MRSFNVAANFIDVRFLVLNYVSLTMEKTGNQHAVAEHAENSGLIQSTELPATYCATGNAVPSNDLVTIDDALEKASIGCGTLFYVLGPILISFFEGAELVVLSVVSLMLQCSWKLSVTETFFIQISPVLGMFLGSSLCSPLSDRFGRKKVLICASTGMLVFGALTGLSGGFVTYLIYQVIVGVSLGGALAPLIAMMVEVVPARWRVAIIAVRTSAKAAGTIFAVLISWWMEDILGWRFIVITISFIGIPTIIGLFAAGESPRYSVLIGDELSAWKTLSRIDKYNQRCGNCLTAHEDGDETESDVDSTKPTKSSSFIEKLFPVNDLPPRVVSEEEKTKHLDNQTRSTVHPIENLDQSRGRSGDICSTSSSERQIITEVENRTTPVFNLSRSASRMSDLVEGEPDLYNIMKFIKNNHLAYDIFFITVYGFAVQAIYYAYTLFAARLVKDKICDDNDSMYQSPELVHSLQCAINAEQLLELSITYIVGPLGAILAALSSEWIGRRPTGYIIAGLLIVLNSYYYTCTSRTARDLILGLVAVVKCGADLLPFLVASEYFPTAIRGFCVSMCVTGAKFGACLSIFLCQYVYNLSPIYIVIYIHILCVLTIVAIFFLKKETRGLKLADV